MDIKGKVALITGSSRGLGRAAAIALSKEGASVVVNYLEQKDKANEVVKLIQGMGNKAVAIQADVSKSEDIARMSKQVFEEFGDVDILINNAGIIARPADWLNITDEDLDHTIGVHVKGTINCTKAFAPAMIKNKAGRIINITSTYAITGASAVVGYTAAKAGIISLTYGMAKELGGKGITVNAIAPGNFDTDMTQSAGQATIDWAVSTTPLGRLGKPEEIGDAVVYLVKSDFITGHVLVVDGGQLLNI